MSTIESLKDECLVLKTTVDSAINWIESHVDTAEKESVIDALRMQKRLTSRYENTIRQNISTAIFGESQVGKSYLVSNLVRTPGASILEISSKGLDPIDLGKYIKEPDQKINYIEYVNPPGDDKEATGFVTRFTTKHSTVVNGKPYQVKIFNQTDLVKIFMNSYCSDFREYVFTINAIEIQEHLNRLKQRCKEGVQNGCTIDDIYDIRDYARENFKENVHIVQLEQINFWEDLIIIAPYLKADERSEIFDILWGKLDFFTDLFKMLTLNLENLSFANSVYCGFDAFIHKSKTILDLERIRENFTDYVQEKTNELGWAELEPVSVVGNNGVHFQIDRSVLSTLAYELVLPLPEQIAENPDRKLLQNLDILDFPGARTRLFMEEQAFILKTKSDDKIEAFIRGKVAYIFDRYQRNLEINSMVFCQHNTQPNVAEVKSLVYRWISSMIGSNASEREETESRLSAMMVNQEVEIVNPLLFVMTKFNLNLSEAKDKELKGLPIEHDAKWTSKLSENFSSYLTRTIPDKWTESWNKKDGSFKNSFALRDPNFSVDIYKGFENGDEQVKDAHQKQRLKVMGESFINHPITNKFFRVPQTAWQETTMPGMNGGVDYIIRYLNPLSNIVLKEVQLSRAIKIVKNKVGKTLCQYFDAGDTQAKLLEANKKALQVFLGLSNFRDKMGLFLDKIILQEEKTWKITYSVIHDGNIEKEVLEGQKDNFNLISIKEALQTAGFSTVDFESKEALIKRLEDHFGMNIDILMDMFKSQNIDLKSLIENKSTLPSKADIFANKLLSEWLKDIKSPSVIDEIAQLGVSSNLIEMLLNEMVKNMDRVSLAKNISDNVFSHLETFTTHENYDVIARIATVVVNDFVVSFGWNLVDFENKQDIKVKPADALPIFANRAINSMSKKELLLDMKFPGETYFSEIFTGIQKSFAFNVLAESQFTNPEKIRSNAQLGEIIQKIDYSCLDIKE